MEDPFIATVLMFGGNFAPRGWAFCEGQLLPISQYDALFSLLGTTYGGDGRTTFALPDLRGRANIGAGNGPGLTPYHIGNKGGTPTTALINNNLPAHNHALTTSDGPVTQPTGASGYFPSNPGGRGGTSLYASAAGTVQSMSAMTNNQGSGTAFNNMQPYTCVNFIIALVGIYPSRN